MKRIKKHTISPAAASRVRRAGREAAAMMKLVAKNPGIQELLALHRDVQMTESIWAYQNYAPTRSGSTSGANMSIL